MMKRFNLFILTMILSLSGLLSYGQVAYSGKDFEVDWQKVNFIMEHENLTYKKVDGLELKLDILAKKGLTGLAPVMVYVHGGDWNKGNKTDVHRPKVKEVVQRVIDMGYRVISIDYRLCRPQTLITGAVADTKDAVRWIKHNGSQYGINTSKIVFMGTSAGGHISMLAAYSSDSDPDYAGDDSLKSYSSSVGAVINCYGPVEVDRSFRFQTGITTQIARWIFNKTLYQFFKETAYDFSGLSYPNDRGELRRYMKKYSVNSIESPRNIPLITLHGTSDFTVQANNARVLKKYLDRNGITNEMNLYKGVKHSFVEATPAQMTDMGNNVQDFLNRYIK